MELRHAGLAHAHVCTQVNQCASLEIDAHNRLPLTDRQAAQRLHHLVHALFLDPSTLKIAPCKRDMPQAWTVGTL